VEVRIVNSENIIIIIPAVIAVSVFVSALIKSRKYRGIPEPQIVTGEKVIKERNKKLNTFLMVIYVVLMLVSTMPGLFMVILTPEGRVWTIEYPEYFLAMTFQATGVVIVSLLGWRVMIWFYYNVMGGRSLLDRLRERRKEK